ncbi:MAG: hypothetical protein LKJ03_02140 [Enterococcaceae bacterium]|nr:hypothetical protein [Enterococcaceae bacterium]MCI1918689.1 hypothetical protein [Enterococcaceae bacterium]
MDQQAGTNVYFEAGKNLGMHLDRIEQVVELRLKKPGDNSLCFEEQLADFLTRYRELCLGYKIPCFAGFSKEAGKKGVEERLLAFLAGAEFGIREKAG